jgi:hypothetical protein
MISRYAILERDGYACQVCGERADIVHHKDGHRSNNDPSNLISLCGSHHAKKHIRDGALLASVKTSAPCSKAALADLNEIKFTLMAERRREVTVAEVVSLLIAEHKERNSGN